MGGVDEVVEVVSMHRFEAAVGRFGRDIDGGKDASGFSPPLMMWGSRSFG